MLGSYLYWITTAALVFCLFISLMRRQTIRDLAEARRKLLDERQEREQMRAELVHVRNAAEKDLAAAKKQTTDANATSTEPSFAYVMVAEMFSTSTRRSWTLS